MAKRNCLIGLDIGTSSVKAVAIDVEDGSPLASARQNTPIARTGQTVELPAAALRHGVENTLLELVRSLPGNTDVAGLATTSVGESGAPVDGSGRVLRDPICWPDTRSASQVERLIDAIGDRQADTIVGHAPDPTWGVGRIMWVRENEPHIYDRTADWLPIADLATLWLTGRRITSPSLASRQMAWDQEHHRWSSRILRAACLDPGRMPEVAPSGTAIGTIGREAAERTGLPVGMSVSLGGHDRQCGAFAARAGSAAAVDSAGTAEGLLVPSRGTDEVRRLGTGIARYADVVPGVHTYAARVGLAGGLLDWARQTLAVTEELDYARLLVAVPVPYAFTGVVATPTFGRYASPHWAPGAVPGALFGLTTSHTRADLIQALLEAPAFSLRANLERLESWLPGQLDGVRIEGGIVKNRPWLQARADITGRHLQSVENEHMTAVGAALLAGVGAGVYSSCSEAGAALSLAVRDWFPDPVRAEQYTEAYHRLVRPLAELCAGAPSPELQHGIDYNLGEVTSQ